MSFDIRRYCLALFDKNVLALLALLTLVALPISSQKPIQEYSGLAWQVRGTWQVDGTPAPILTGDYVPAGSLLQPGAGSANNSITVLLPDGQLILYECFTADDCSRGFQVPALYRVPESLAVNMLAHIHEGLAANVSDLAAGSATPQRPRLPRDEQVAVLGPDSRVHVEGLAARLPNGHYIYDVRPLDRSHPRQFHLELEKNGSSITVALPSAGLYFVTLRDALNMPRIDLFIAAVETARSADVEKAYRDGAALMKEWNKYYLGWPVHDFQRAYLTSLLLGPNALPKDGRADAADSISSLAELPAKATDTAEDRTRMAAEPEFSPKPGLFDKELAIALQCKTTGATIHFTVDGSQPVASSPVYRAPIIVKTSVLTIKSFASVTGRKDSPVVTGIFRIKE
jgi:hypothetical protein